MSVCSNGNWIPDGGHFLSGRPAIGDGERHLASMPVQSSRHGTDGTHAQRGCLLAADEYASENVLGWFLHRVDPHVRLAVKPKAS